MPGGKQKLRGKHKRGERGSVEEEENCKRLNMASEDNVEMSNEESSEVQEPSNLELKEMLVDIKIELSNIVRENNKFAKEIAELRNLIKEQTTELDSLKTSIMKAKKKTSPLKTSYSPPETKSMSKRRKSLSFINFRTIWNSTRGSNPLKSVVFRQEHMLQLKKQY